MRPSEAAAKPHPNHVVSSPVEILQIQLDEPEKILSDAGFREVAAVADKPRARRLAESLRTAASNASARRLIIAAS